MSVSSADLGKVVTWTSGQGDTTTGLMLAYCDRPTAMLKLPDGSTINVRADMCAEASLDEHRILVSRLMSE
jgi:hypothetical protein